MENITEPMIDEHICCAVGCNAIADHKCKCRIVIQDTNKEVIEDIWICHNCYMRQKAMEDLGSPRTSVEI